mmetsp:Transcript_30066/g.51161  ORF Transcript_30066/g.51161 Transcript_30066/m.51161 type:complete len:288 (+) Transcript_30066:232-1095(+)
MSKNRLRSFAWRITWREIKERKGKRPQPRQWVSVQPQQRALVDLGLLLNPLQLLASPQQLLPSEHLRQHQVVCLAVLQPPLQLEACSAHRQLPLCLANLHLLRPLELPLQRLVGYLAVLQLLPQREACLERPPLPLLLANPLQLQLLELPRQRQVVCLVRRLLHQLEACLEHPLLLLPLVSLLLLLRLELLHQRRVCLAHRHQLLLLGDSLEQHLLQPQGGSLVSPLQPQQRPCSVHLLQHQRRGDYLVPQHQPNQVDSLVPPHLLLVDFLVKHQHLLQGGCLVPHL